MTNEVSLPNNWLPRWYQKPLWRYLENGGKRVYEVAHRRWGKDDVCLHWTAIAAMTRPANYWHMLPEQAQARKAIWTAVNPHTGIRRIDEAFPHEIRKRTLENEMVIEFVNGSIWQVLGSDNYNSYVGSPPAGVVLSEWALADPQAWAYLMPILEENGGWAFFITTPRGRNHAKRFYDTAIKDDEWFAEKSVASQTGVFKPEQLDKIRGTLIDQYGEDEGSAKFEQEYECSFDAALPGAYYGREVNAAENEGRISGVPYDPRHSVIAVFDLGYGDSTAICFVQMVGREPRIIDYHEASGQGMDYYGKLLREKPYPMASVILPHDGASGSLASGTTYEKQMRGMGFNVRVLPRGDLDAGITLARSLLKQAWFDKGKCERLIDCLRNYHREWDEKNKVFRPRPKHDWSSHAADAFRYVAEAFNAGWLAHQTVPNVSMKLPHGRMGL